MHSSRTLAWRAIGSAAGSSKIVHGGIRRGIAGTITLSKGVLVAPSARILAASNPSLDLGALAKTVTGRMPNGFTIVTKVMFSRLTLIVYLLPRQGTKHLIAHPQAPAALHASLTIPPQADVLVALGKASAPKSAAVKPAEALAPTIAASMPPPPPPTSTATPAGEDSHEPATAAACADYRCWIVWMKTLPFIICLAPPKRAPDALPCSRKTKGSRASCSKP